MFAWPNRIKLANLPTPVTQLTRFSSRFPSIDIRVKRDELTGLEVSGNKVRKLEFCIAQALDDGCDTLITCGGLQSNHCRATAILGARLGLKVHLILRGEAPPEADGNLLLDLLSGAAISYLSQRDWAGHPDLARELQHSYAAQGRRAAFFPVGASDEVGLWGYVAACAELKQDFSKLDWTPDVIVVATGSGGTQSGLIAGTALLEMTPRIVSFAVSDDADWFDQKVRRDLQLWKQRYAIPIEVTNLPVVTLDSYLGPGYGKAGPEVFAMIAELARLEGLILDPVYTGKAFHGMVAELEKAASGQQSSLAGARKILFIHTGGLFGLFPQRRQFEFTD